MRTDRRMWIAAMAVALLAAPSAAGAQDYESLYMRYLMAARETPAAPMWMTDLASDPTARRLNDLVTIDVIESLTATGAADSTVGKSSSNSVSLPTPVADYFAKFLPASADTKFNGAGGTSRSTQLAATITARVREVLPNGDLVVEGVREIDINGDRSLVVLTGVVRPADILPGNIVPSPRVGQLRIQSFSQGLIKDSLTPGWLTRVLNKVF